MVGLRLKKQLVNVDADVNTKRTLSQDGPNAVLTIIRAMNGLKYITINVINLQQIIVK